MRRKLAVCCLVFTVIGQVAVAGVVDECRQEDKRSEGLLRACTEIIKSSNFKPDEKALAYVSRGEAHADAGADRQALADFTEAIRLQKGNPAAFAGRGRAKFALGNLRGSVADFSEAIRLSPVYADFYVQRGHVYRVLEQPDPAIRDFAEALRLVPGDWSAFNERGLANSEKGNLITTEGKHVAAQTYYSAALDDLTAAIAIVPHPVFYANRGYLLESQGKTEDAIKDFKQALLGDPSLVDAKRALERLGGSEPAATDSDELVRKGKVLAEKNCGGCHGLGAAGISLNKDATAFQNIFREHKLYALRRPVAQAILAAHEKMPQFNASSQDVDTIVAYINSFSTGR